MAFEVGMIKALAITGPTASGKTAISIEVAKSLNAEIICCDSMQIYKLMDIGTAKPTAEERATVPHYMTDFLMPNEPYSARSYKNDAERAAKEIFSRGKTPIFVGGTGLYMDTLMRTDSAEVPESSPEYRDEILAKINSEDDAKQLWQRLYSVDAESAEKIHYNNVKRVIRALEIYDKTGVPKSQLDKMTSFYNPELSVKMITIDFHDRQALYDRVDRRVDQMMRDGLLREVESLYKMGYLEADTTAAQAIGYKELLPALKGETSLPDAVESLKLSTRRYAKRQLTWFRHNDAYRLFAEDECGIVRYISDLAAEAVSVAEKLLNE